jgi:hypothetical protein
MKRGQAPTASENARNASGPNNTNRTSVTDDSGADRTAATAIGAASSTGYPYTPQEIAGNATDRAPSDSATANDDRWHDRSRPAGSSTAEYTGPTVWMTHRHGSNPAVVATA